LQGVKNESFDAECDGLSEEISEEREPTGCQQSMLAVTAMTSSRDGALTNARRLRTRRHSCPPPERKRSDVRQRRCICCCSGVEATTVLWVSQADESAWAGRDEYQPAPKGGQSSGCGDRCQACLHRLSLRAKTPRRRQLSAPLLGSLTPAVSTPVGEELNLGLYLALKRAWSHLRRAWGALGLGLEADLGYGAGQ
jgi:hypothetical protein